MKNILKTLLAASALVQPVSEASAWDGSVGTFRFGSDPLRTPVFEAASSETLATLDGTAAEISVGAVRDTSTHAGRGTAVVVTLASGRLPPGATVSSDGRILVAPFETDGSTYEFSLKAVDAFGLATVRSFKLASAPPTLGADGSSVLPSAISGDAAGLMLASGVPARVSLADGRAETGIRGAYPMVVEYDAPISFDRFLVDASGSARLQVENGSGVFVDAGPVFAAGRSVVPIGRTVTGRRFRFSVVAADTTIGEFRPNEAPVATSPVLVGATVVASRGPGPIAASSDFLNRSPYSTGISVAPFFADGLALSGSGGVVTLSTAATVDARPIVRATTPDGSYLDQGIWVPAGTLGADPTRVLPTSLVGDARGVVAPTGTPPRTILADGRADTHVTDVYGTVVEYAAPVSFDRFASDASASYSLQVQTPSGAYQDVATGIQSGARTHVLDRTVTGRRFRFAGAPAGTVFREFRPGPGGIASAPVYLGQARIVLPSGGVLVSATDFDDLSPYSDKVVLSLPGSQGSHLTTDGNVVRVSTTPDYDSGVVIRATSDGGSYLDQSVVLAGRLGSSPPLTFGTCGATGDAGPAYAACNGAYAGTALANDRSAFDVQTAGYQVWTVPSDATYEIQADGASGGGVTGASGGRGASLTGRYALKRGQKLTMVVGQMGLSTTADATGAGGGGGTFVMLDGVPILAAGGGSGASRNATYATSLVAGLDASPSSPSGGDTIGPCSTILRSTVSGGANGAGGGAGCAGGGGGYLSSGAGAVTHGGSSVKNGTAIGSGSNGSGGKGGFGGGSAGTSSNGFGGAGGGWSGGAGSGYDTAGPKVSPAGGGGSFADTSSSSALRGLAAYGGHGRVVVRTDFDASFPLRDTVPDTFSFASVGNGEPGTAAVSLPVLVSGHDGVDFSLASGSHSSAAYQICAAADCSDQTSATWTSSVTANVQTGRYVRMRITPATVGSTVTATLAAGGTSATFSVAAPAAMTPLEFTNCGKTGIAGPSYSECNAAYAGTKLAGDRTVFDVTTAGYQVWTVPTTGVYQFAVRGAAGGGSTGVSGGNGALVTARFSLTQGDKLTLVVGQMGSSPGQTTVAAGGGGGGSYVIRSGTLLAAAGGGGGGAVNNGVYVPSAVAGLDARPSSTSGGDTIGPCGSGRTTIAGGTNGGGGTAGCAGAGAGYLSAGGNAGTANGGQHVGGGSGAGGTNGKLGGFGGFGGGGSGTSSNGFGGGGGGYSGGAGGGYDTSGPKASAAAGGGSFVAGAGTTVSTELAAAGLQGKITVSKP